MDKLWAPWRAGYIRAKKQKGCFFCSAKKSIFRPRSGLTVSGVEPSKSKSYVIIQNKFSFAMLNKYPYNNGHVLVAPLRHIKDISNLKKEEVIDIFMTLKEVKDILDKVLKPQGFNLGINISRFAGAGIAGHMHLHVVPRWQGDTNFMPVIYNTKIVPQSLDELYKKLKIARNKYAKTK
jgi:ATP adenylyltransferase